MTNRDLIIFSFGAAIGAVVAYFYTKREVEKSLYEEYHKLAHPEEPEEKKNDDVVVKDTLDLERRRIEREENIERTASIIRDLNYNDEPDAQRAIPYIIDSADAGSEGYSLCAINWWPNYNFATDEVDGGEIGDVYDLCGRDNILTIEQSGELVGYIRNDDLGVDYEVTICHGECPYIQSKDFEGREDGII